MVNRHTARRIRKTHRYLGLFIGIQFLMWTISGLYFSWTDLDEIHGDQFKKEINQESFSDLLNPSEIIPDLSIENLQLKNIAGVPHYWINNEFLVNAENGKRRTQISEEEALKIAAENVLDELKVEEISLITETGKHHEYRGQFLPAYVISYENHGNLKAYVSAQDGSFRSVRHRDWRWFDFLWMTHTMDYEGRDDFNNFVLRAFSLLGLITVLSGFVLWFISSATVRKIWK